MADLEKLDKAINELEKQSKDLKDFNSVYSEIASLKKEILEQLDLIKSNNQGLSDISKAIENRLDESQKKIDETYKDNKAFQKELDSSLVSRLDKHKSDIQVEIRNEGTQIQRAFETTLNSIFKQFEDKVKDAFEKQNKRSNALLFLSICLIIINVAIGIGVVFLFR